MTEKTLSISEIEQEIINIQSDVAEYCSMEDLPEHLTIIELLETVDLTDKQTDALLHYKWKLEMLGYSL